MLLAIHKVTQQQFACKVVRKDTKMNDAQVRAETSMFRVHCTVRSIFLYSIDG